MEYKNITDTIKIPVLGLGTWTIGGKLEANHSNDQEEIKAIKQAVDLGYTHIDTAESYGAGHCEELVGDAIKDCERAKLFITTKVTNENLHYDNVIKAAKQSLKRLQTDYIDLYLIHAPNPEIDIKETMKAMDFLVSERLVRLIGVSNFNMEQLVEAQGFTKNKITANQLEYSLLTRNQGRYAGNKDMELKTIPYCQENDIIVIAERPVERGALLEPHPLLDELAEKYQKTKAQIAVNWLISKQNVVTIPKSTDVEHLKENLGAVGWTISRKDMERLNKKNFA